MQPAGVSKSLTRSGRSHRPQVLGIGVELFRTLEDFQVSQEVSGEPADEDQLRHRHDRLLDDGVLVELREPSHRLVAFDFIAKVEIADEAVKIIH